MQLCASFRVVLIQIVSNSFSLDLYYLAFPNDRRSLKHLVYGIYVIEFVQTMLVAHDTFAMYGYGFGDIDALTRMNFLWITVPIMSAVGAHSICYPFSLTYLEFSFLCRAGLLCIPNIHIVKVTFHPDIRHLCSLLCSFSIAAQLMIYCLILFTGIIDQFCGSYDHSRLCFPSRQRD